MLKHRRKKLRRVAAVGLPSVILARLTPWPFWRLADIDQGAPPRLPIERRIGVMFQQGALFSGLTVKQNVEVPMREHLQLSPRLSEELAMLKIELAGLNPDAANKCPSELSGGMTKRAALARALALDPELLFLDEPTSRLDPIGGEFDELIATLQRTLGLTVLMVTHDLDSLYSICDRIIALADRKVIASGPMSAMLASQHPWLRAYFHGKRARRIESALALQPNEGSLKEANGGGGLQGRMLNGFLEIE
jgi:phospholipid/cholesterol/gamma-HCH transport system ATP-binding protein